MSEYADVLSEEDLRNHKTYLKVEKLCAILIALGPPGLIFYKTRSYHALVYSFLAFVFISKKFRPRNFLSDECDYSWIFANNSKNLCDKKILGFNGKRFATPKDKWDPYANRKYTPKEWLQLHTYH
jgi:hypothetical protein